MSEIKKYPKSEWEDCPNCPNQGWFVGGNPKTGPEQVQCEFCWTVEKSVFNQEEKPNPNTNG